MTKKYYSTNEYFLIDPITKEQIPYEGYVLVENNIPYTFDDKKELVIGNNYTTKINLSNDFFDRLLDVDLKLPYNLADCTFAANDFLKASVINKIINNLEANNTYIFKNCLIAQNDLPLSEKIPVLSPHRPFASEDKTEFGPVDGWFYSNISYSTPQNIWNKLDWPDTVEGYNWGTEDIIDSIVVPTNKFTDKKDADGNPMKLYAVFIGRSTSIQLMNLYLFPYDELQQSSDPLLNEGDHAEELNQRMFEEISSINNQNISGSNVNNLNIFTFSKIDPNNIDSASFKNISGIALDGNYLYVIDNQLNGLFKYDISKCLSDRGAATNRIMLVDQIQGFGDLNQPYRFNNPQSIAAFDNTIAVFDKGNNVIKVLDNFFNHKFTIRSGGFIRQNTRTVSICPYEFILNEETIEKGSIWVITEAADKIIINIFSNKGEYLGDYQVLYLELLKTYWYNPEDGQPSSDEPIYNQEIVKKIDFSYNNSNYFYIVTNKRIVKFQLSKLTYPIGIISYYYRSITLDDLVWENVYMPWENVQDLGNNLIPWDYDRSTELSAYPQNVCFSITGTPELNEDVIFNIIDNRSYYGQGKLQRVDNYTDNKLLYYDKNRDYTYLKINLDGRVNPPVLVNTGDIVDEYRPSAQNTPEKVEGKTFVIKEEEVIFKLHKNVILFFKEPNILKSSLLKSDINVYSEEELSFKDNQEYYNVLTFNKILYKLFFNLSEIKKYIFGTFVGGYSIDGLMTYDHVKPDSSFQELGSDKENFFMGENELTSIILNRCFTSIYNTQVNIIKKMQTSFISTLNYNINSYRII